MIGSSENIGIGQWLGIPLSPIFSSFDLLTGTSAAFAGGFLSLCI